MEISILQTSKLGLLLQLFNQINKYTHVRGKKTQKPAKLIDQNRHIDTTPKFMVCRSQKTPVKNYINLLHSHKSQICGEVRRSDITRPPLEKKASASFKLILITDHEPTH